MLLSTILVTTVALAYGSTIKIEKNEPEKIVGGEKADIRNRPYQVSLTMDMILFSSLCGGSILSSTKILTAAHCVVDGIRRITVRAGSNYTRSGGATSNTFRYVAHPQYNRITHDYDVAIVDIENDPLPLNNSTIKAVRLALTNGEPADGDPLVVSGWGTTSEGGDVAKDLMEVTVDKISQQNCSEAYDLTPRMLCAGVPEGGKDSCQGDSGGPLVELDGTQVGIVSFGKGCARADAPGVYANVAALREWIDSAAGL